MLCLLDCGDFLVIVEIKKGSVEETLSQLIKIGNDAEQKAQHVKCDIILSDSELKLWGGISGGH